MIILKLEVEKGKGAAFDQNIYITIVTQKIVNFYRLLLALSFNLGFFA